MHMEQSRPPGITGHPLACSLMTLQAMTDLLQPWGLICCTVVVRVQTSTAIEPEYDGRIGRCESCHMSLAEMGSKQSQHKSFQS